MPDYLNYQGVRAATLAALAITLNLPASAHAQDATAGCSQLSGAEEVECLRQALARTQDALTRAERALQTAETAPRPTSEPSAAASLGAEQAARRAGVSAPAQERAQRIQAVIVSSERVYPNQLQVHLENGQTWRQIQGDTQLVELASNERVLAEIWRSGFGGYRMRLPEVGRQLKVERIR